MLKQISVFLAFVGIIMSTSKKYPKVAGIGFILGLVGLLGVYFFS